MLNFAVTKNVLFDDKRDQLFGAEPTYLFPYGEIIQDSFVFIIDIEAKAENLKNETVHNIYFLSDIKQVIAMKNNPNVLNIKIALLVSRSENTDGSYQISDIDEIIELKNKNNEVESYIYLCTNKLKYTDGEKCNASKLTQTVLYKNTD